MSQETWVYVEAGERGSSARITFVGAPAASRVAGATSGGEGDVYRLHLQADTPPRGAGQPSLRVGRRVWLRRRRGTPAPSWRAQIARALQEPLHSKDVALVWRAFLDVLGRTVLAGRPVDPDSDLSATEAAVLARGSADLVPSPATTARVLGRTAGRWADLLCESVGAAEAARMLGVQESRVRQRLADRTLYGFKHDGAWRVPGFQFYQRRLVPGVALVFPRLPATATPVAVETWFTTPTLELVAAERPLSPRDWLMAGGDPAAVAALAALL